MDNVATPSPFKKRDRIPRTPDQYMAYHAQDWQSSRNHDPSPYRQMNVFKRHDALTPENSSEEDREVEETPIYLRSERFRQSFQDGRLTPSSPPDDEYDADSILGAYRGDMRYSFASDGADVSHDSPTPTESRPSEGPVNIQRISITRRDITPSKIPIYYASPKPIPMEYIFRSAPLHRSRSAHLPDLSDDPSSLKRVCSESLLDNPSAQLRSSPTRRKHSTLPRPRSRSLGSARPGLRGMKYSPSPNKRPPSAKGEPPWIQHSFSPNPSLPPEEQLIPTVAKRLEQERLEKEKGLVTVWDRQMRPLEGDRRYDCPTSMGWDVLMTRMRESRVRTHKEADDMPTGNIPVDENAQPKNSFEEKTWPLNIDLKKAKREGLSVVPSPSHKRWLIF